MPVIPYLSARDSIFKRRLITYAPCKSDLAMGSDNQRDIHANNWWFELKML